MKVLVTGAAGFIGFHALGAYCSTAMRWSASTISTPTMINH